MNQHDPWHPWPFNQPASNTPADGGANNFGSRESGTSLASLKPEVAAVAPPKPDQLPAAAGADEMGPPDCPWRNGHTTPTVKESLTARPARQLDGDPDDDSDEFTFPRSRRLICSASSDGQFSIHRFGDTGITLTAAEAKTVFQFLEDAQPIFERIAP